MIQFIQKKVSIFLCCLLMVNIGIGYAYTDNARMLNGLENTRGPIYDYLNTNNFHFYNKENFNYSYIQNDNSLFVIIVDGLTGGYAPLIGHNGWLAGIIFLKPGHKTDKGIAVGMKLDELVKAYGPVYPMNRHDIYENDINTGCYKENTYNYKSNWGDTRKINYYLIAYRDRQSGEIEFIVDKSTKKIRAISFQYVVANDYPYFWRSLDGQLNNWGLWRYVLTEMNENPLKSTWRGLKSIFN